MKSPLYPYSIRYYVDKWYEKVIMWIVWNVIPYKLRYWTVIRAWADASSGKYGHVEAPAVLVADALNRMK